MQGVAASVGISVAGIKAWAGWKRNGEPEKEAPDEGTLDDEVEPPETMPLGDAKDRLAKL